MPFISTKLASKIQSWVPARVLAAQTVFAYVVSFSMISEVIVVVVEKKQDLLCYPRILYHIYTLLTGWVSDILLHFEECLL